MITLFIDFHWPVVCSKHSTQEFFYLLSCLVRFGSVSFRSFSFVWSLLPSFLRNCMSLQFLVIRSIPYDHHVMQCCVVICCVLLFYVMLCFLLIGRNAIFMWWHSNHWTMKNVSFEIVLNYLIWFDLIWLDYLTNECDREQTGERERKKN